MKSWWFIEWDWFLLSIDLVITETSIFLSAAHQPGLSDRISRFLWWLNSSSVSMSCLFCLRRKEEISPVCHLMCDFVAQGICLMGIDPLIFSMFFLQRSSPTSYRQCCLLVSCWPFIFQEMTYQPDWERSSPPFLFSDFRAFRWRRIMPNVPKANKEVPRGAANGARNWHAWWYAWWLKSWTWCKNPVNLY